MSIEEGSRKRLRATRIRTAILSTIQLAGILAVVAVAPNVVQLLGRGNSRSRHTSAKSALARLIKAGLIEIETRNGQRYVQLTKKGLRYLTLHTLKIQKPRTWDGRWRVVIFDIAESRSKLRQQLRSNLKQIGFARLQNSVWIYPYDCEDLLVLLKANYELGKEVLYIVADTIENDASFRRHFKV